MQCSCDRLSIAESAGTACEGAGQSGTQISPIETGTVDDDQLREPSVMDLTLVAWSGSQVIALHGITIPCRYFRGSENTGTSGVLGRVGHDLGQFARDSRSHHFLKRAPG